MEEFEEKMSASAYGLLAQLVLILFLCHRFDEVQIFFLIFPDLLYTLPINICH